MIDRIRSVFDCFQAVNVLKESLNVRSTVLSGAAGSSAAFVAAILAEEKKFLCVFDAEVRATQFYEDVCELLGESRVVYYPNRLWLWGKSISTRIIRPWGLRTPEISANTLPPSG